MTLTTAVVVVLVLVTVHLALRIRNLTYRVERLEKPRKRERAIRREIQELETDLRMVQDIITNGAAKPEDFAEGDAIRAKLDNRRRALVKHMTGVTSPPHISE